jgi:TRAP-type C4-dicarboxylate transport system permease large subunit
MVMGFTLKALLPPFVCFVLMGLMTNFKVRDNTTALLGTMIMGWGFVAFMVVVVYWISRIWKRATRDAPDPHWPR